jgi:beta-1,4-mannosyltransferase
MASPAALLAHLAALPQLLAQHWLAALLALPALYGASLLLSLGRHRSAVAVVVLGDIGRSPRMQYHCTSLADLPSTTVHIVAYRGERCVPTLEARANVVQHLLSSPFGGCPRRLFLLTAPLKVAWQVLQLLGTLLTMPPPRAVLVQNPPSIPALAVVWAVCALRRARMVIDWHNFGYTVLGLGLGEGHPAVHVSRVYERACARRAHAHLCVTNAMRLWLQDEWGVRARLLYDRPPPFFKPTGVQERHELFGRLAQQLPPVPAGEGGAASPRAAPASRSRGASAASPKASAAAAATAAADAARAASPPAPASRSRGASAASARARREEPAPLEPAQPLVQRTLITGVNARTGLAALLPSRPAVLVSSTSWTADEDFSMLLEALVLLDGVISAPHRRASFPDFLVLITGKGPLRAEFEARASALRLARTRIRTLWLAPSDYPLLLGSADCGISLHASTSGLDLPMKVVDMFGAGLPVCALGFSCLAELVHHDRNGLIFRTARELGEQLEGLFEGFPAQEPSAGHLARLRKGVAVGLQSRWEENWAENAAQLFR